ncbi:MAG: glycosyltransferase family 39 protein [Candidatus Nealsonbacteria bacterium]
MNKKYLIILVLIILAGLFLRIYPFEAKSWIGEVDTLIVREALDLGQGIIEKDYSFLQETIAYPFVLPFLLLFCYGIFYLLGSWFGLFSSVQGFISYLFFHIDEFYWLSRILIGVFGILSVILVYLIVREIFSRIREKKIILGSLLAAYVLSFSLLSIQFSQQVRPHVPVAFFILLSFYLYLLCLKKKRWNLYLLLVLVVGLAVGTFPGGIFAFIFIILVNYFLERKYFKFQFIDFLKTFFSFRFIVGLITFLIIFFLFYPYALFNFNLDINTADSSNSVSINLFNSSFPVSSLGMGFVTIFKMLFSQELALGLLLVLFSFLYFVYRKNIVTKDIFYNQAIIGWWAFVISYSVIFGFLDFGGRFRLLCSIVPFLSIGLGILLINVFNSLNKYKKWIFFVVIVLLIFESVQAIRFIQLMDRPYSRDEASQWLENNVLSDELILFQQPIQTLIPTKKSIEVHSFLSGLSLSQRNQFLLSLELDNYPLNSKSILDFGDVMKYKDNNVSAVYEFLKEVKPDYFVLLFRSMDLEREEYIEYQIAQKQGQLVKKFSPFKSETNRELFFPSGLNNPLIDLWVANQLGPTVEIYKLDWNND